LFRISGFVLRILLKSKLTDLGISLVAASSGLDKTMTPYGYMGKILHVDLTSAHHEVKGLDLEVARSYLGGLGLNAWLMEQAYTTGTDPLSPDNPLILGTGPLVATGAPGAAKIVATTRFPLNGTISESVGSMRFALNLKGAGFDHLIITGRAKKPVVLALDHQGVSFIDAGDLWGRDIFETTDALKKSHGGPKSSVIAIGPAGEQGAVFSLALVDKASTLGRGGLGAVMGSKNLKAILAKGDKRPRVYDSAELKALLAGIRERLKRFKNHPRVLELGIVENWDNYVQQFSACRNFSRVFPPEKATELYGPDVYQGFKIKRLGCPSCYTPDKDHIQVKSGPFQGFTTTTTSYLNSFMIGHLFDLNQASDTTASLRFTDQLDRLGLDMFTFGSMMDFLVTESEQDRLDPARFGLPLKRDMETLGRWAEAIASMEQGANILAGGWRSLLEFLGPEYNARAPIIKDCDILWEPRLVGLGTMEFEQIVSLKGPRSASGGSPTYVPGQTEENLPLFCRHLERMGASEKAIERIMDSPLGFNVARMTRYSEDWYTILSSLGICNRHFNNRFYSLELCEKLWGAATGFQMGEEHLRQSAALIWDTLKRLNQKEGFGPTDDRPPEIWFAPMTGLDSQALVLRDYFGKTQLTKEDIARLVEDYYDERGW
jgi:aldehyde:ferredoxin oxidoreductase